MCVYTMVVKISTTRSFERFLRNALLALERLEDEERILPALPAENKVDEFNDGVQKSTAVLAGLAFMWKWSVTHHPAGLAFYV